MTARLCACGCGASLADLRSDAVYASEACSKRHKCAASADKGPTRKECQAMAEGAILDHFRNPEHEPFHSDDLWHVIPDEHRGVISLAVMALVNRKLIVGCGHRKSAIPSRKRSPSQEYRLTELGRDRILAGVRNGVAPAPPSGAGFDRTQARTTADPGENSPAGSTHAPGCPLPAGEPRPTTEAVPLFEEEKRPLNPLRDREAA